ncbi:ABC transporter permease [Bacillus anthracis]|nr:ABC transporter permease [Bacillus anthracis]KOS25436.1 ABC transporter permease [Bacillus anthracis]
MTFWQFAFKNVSRNSRAYFAYFVSSAFSIAVFFSFAVYLFHPKLQIIGIISEITGLMIISEVVIVFFHSSFYYIQLGLF